jgi:pantothenate synthetase
MQALLAAEPLARIDYVSVADDETLRECSVIDGPAVASLAVFVGRTRLIDNVRLAPDVPDPFAGTALEDSAAGGALELPGG